jgi:predicted nucleic acid-binding protein
MNAVDTNVLIYARDKRDPVKQQKACALTAKLKDGALLWQVACEFIAASRKLTTVGYATRFFVSSSMNALHLRPKVVCPFLPHFETSIS